MAAGGSLVSSGFMGVDGSESALSPGTKGLKRYECPVCLDVLIPPIYQCHNGHIFCKDCEPRLVSCPICRESLPQRKIRTLALEDIILEMSLECKSKEFGCQALLNPLELEEHEYQCAYTKHYFCKILKISCNHESSLADVVEHFQTAHGLTGLDLTNLWKNENPWVEIQQKLPRSDVETLPPKTGFVPHYFVFEGHRFLLTSKLDLKEKTMAWKVTVLGGKSVSSRFSVKMKLVADSKLSSEEHKWNGSVADLKATDSSNCFFKVRLSTLERFSKGFSHSFGSIGFRWSLHLKLITGASIKKKILVPSNAILETATFPRNTQKQQPVTVQHYPTPHIPEFPLADGFHSTVFGTGHGSPFHFPWDQGYCVRPSRVGILTGSQGFGPAVFLPPRGRP